MKEIVLGVICFAGALAFGVVGVWMIVMVCRDIKSLLDELKHPLPDNFDDKEAMDADDE